MIRITLLLASLVCTMHPACAWGPDGHKVIGAIADNMLSANANQRLATVLGTNLKTAGPWLDCAKSVQRETDGTFSYHEDPRYEPPCSPFKLERARLEDYAKRNWSNCSYKTQGVERGCHNTYHFDDVAIQRDRFDRNFQGTNDHDLVAAINAAIAVLLDRPSPPPFSIVDKKEAIFLLAHLVGDLHQPLHVGSVYLDSDGKLVDPDVTHTIDPATETLGGNVLLDLGKNLHGQWDANPPNLADEPTQDLIHMANAVPPDRGRIENWSVAWATDTLLAAQQVFAQASFSKAADGKWSISFTDHAAYLRMQNAMKLKQMAKAGARLAEILNTVWP